MSRVQSSESKVKEETVTLERDDAEVEDLSVVDGEIMEVADGDKSVSKTENQRPKTEIINKEQKTKGDERIRQSAVRHYILLPIIFLSVALLGGLRIEAGNSAFLFLKPALVCLIFASVLLVLFFRADLIRLDGWFSENFSTLKNLANAGVLLALFAASTQIFNSLLPERGLPFWTIAFCFFWTLWNNLFAEFHPKKLVKSLGGMFALAFAVKYLVLANLTAPPSDSLWQRITESPTQEAFTWLLDLPRFAAATGYIQFFTLVFYLIGLFLLKPETRDGESSIINRI